VERTGRHAVLVASGILLSRLAGLVRNRFFSTYFGLRSDAADAFQAAFKIPNILQNLFGEGVLSASFIPVYSRLLANGDDEESGKVAGAVGALLALAVSVLVLVGVIATPYLIGAIAPGFQGAKRELTIRLTRVLFPGAGLMVLSAWCLGILNSHRRFFVSYASPVVWNMMMIAALIVYGGRVDQPSLVVKLSWASVIGSALLVLVQMPQVLILARRLRIRLDARHEHVREVIRSFGPVFVSRGVVQISAYIDAILASYLPMGAVNGLNYAQNVNMLPVSLIGMAISAAELPAMSSLQGDPAEVAASLRRRLDVALSRLAFLIIPSAMAFLAIGDVIAGLLFQSGHFHHEDAVYVWGILAGSAVGLLASTLGRLYSSTYYALRDTRTPLKFAVIRVALTTGLGYVCALPLPRWIGIDPLWGVAGLTASAGFAGWVEFSLLRSSMNRRIGWTGLHAGLVAKLWLSAAVAAAAAWGAKFAIGHSHPVTVAAVVIPPYGLAYFAMTYLLHVEECTEMLRRVRRFF
jgi:putative peptidoglycan lipid II flippase